VKLLLVEDNAMLAASLIGLLERKDLEIVHCVDAKTAIAVLATKEFDLVISDYSLGPGEKGDAVLRAAQSRQPKARRVLMSGEDEAGRFTKDGLAQAFYLKDGQSARSLVLEVEAILGEGVAL
jgi:DNA-binding NtrC family response regulator